jgi:histidinol-phosphate aminotransferase
MMSDEGPGLRLHLNENTAGCSPRVFEAISRLTREDAAFYPSYGEVTAAVAAYLEVDPSWVLVVNGLDEGLQAAATACLLRGADGRARDAVIVEPAFEMYAACADAVGGRLVRIPPVPDFSFPLDDVLAGMTADTGVVYLASPNNPTGLAAPGDALRTMAARLPADALIFLDEAYAEFAEEDFLRELPSVPNMVIGRTFAKAHGLAAIRAGAVVAAPHVIARLRRVVAPYSVNVFASTAMVAALSDRAYLEWYRSQVRRSRDLFYAACERLGLTCWHSQANFVLIRIGDRAQEVVQRLAERRIFVRDRSSQPGCGGCVRITAGIVSHSERCIAALEEILCAAH